MTIKSTVFGVVPPWGSVTARRFRETYCLSSESKIKSSKLNLQPLSTSLNLKIGAICSSETSGCLLTIQHYSSGVHALHCSFFCWVRCFDSKPNYFSVTSSLKQALEQYQQWDRCGPCGINLGAWADGHCYIRMCGNIFSGVRMPRIWKCVFFLHFYEETKCINDQKWINNEYHSWVLYLA